MFIWMTMKLASYPSL